MIKVLLIAAGALLSVNGAFLCVASNMNVGVILTLAVGLLLLGWGIFYNEIKRKTGKIWKAVKIAVAAALIVELALCVFLAVYGQLDNVDYTEDAVIVLGAGVHGEKISVVLRYRLDAAVDYYRRNPKALLVVTGGQGPQEDITEAEAMERYLLSRGIPKESILKEEQATRTAENLRYSDAILRERFGDYEAAVVTNRFHIFRAVLIAKRENISVKHLHAGIQVYDIASCYLRETLAIVKTILWG